MTLRLPCRLMSLALAACVQGGATSTNDPETVGGIIECVPMSEVTPLGGASGIRLARTVPGQEGVSFDPNLYLLDCRKQKQITVFKRSNRRPVDA